MEERELKLLMSIAISNRTNRSNCRPDKEVQPPSEWARVQQMREEEHPLVFGGQCAANRGLYYGDGRKVTLCRKW